MVATIKDIAREAGVAISTASNVLNNKTGAIKASEGTRQRILRAAAALDYSPSVMAKGLRSGKSCLAGVMLPAIYGSFIPEILQGVEDVLHDNDYNMILCTFKDAAEFRGKWTVLRAKKVDGIITLPSQDEAFLAAYAEMTGKIPLVFTAGKVARLDIPYAYVPPEDIARLAARYLLGQGHRNIGILGPRRGGYLEAFLAEMGKYPESKHCVSREFSSFADTAPEFKRMREEFPAMTAVMAYNDEVAAVAINEARKLGMNVPEDLSVMGVDDLPICEMAYPRITTIAQPRREQGSSAARLLMDLINNKTVVGGVSLAPRLVERESCNIPRRTSR